ncbi:MAG: hypothetical protein V3V20_10065 [Algisphaera sp.]
MPARFFTALLPSRQPLMARGAYRRELGAASTFTLAVALLEGGVVGVLSKTIFDVSNLGFAAITAAPMFANLTSVAWTRAARGRRKAVFTSGIMAALLGVVALVALLPTTHAGGVGLVGAVVLGRCLLSGLVTVRSATWRLNFPRHTRARITGRVLLVASLVLAMVPLGVGPLLDAAPWSFRLIYPLAAAIGLVGVFCIRGLRVRTERSLLYAEQNPTADADTPTRRDGRPHNFASVLCEDHRFRQYMVCQFLAGVSNMMGNTAFALLIVESVRSRSDANQLGMTLTTTLPLILATLSVPLWSRLLDRTHITTYRIGHGLTWVFGQSLCFIAAWWGHLWLLFLPQAMQGLMRGGGMIAWQLGHNDFADRRLAALYMGIHQTLTGVRGAFAPFLGVWLLAGHNTLNVAGFQIPAWEGIREGVFVITTLLAIAAWAGFWRLSVMLKREGLGHAADG